MVRATLVFLLVSAVAGAGRAQDAATTPPVAQPSTDAAATATPGGTAAASPSPPESSGQEYAPSDEVSRALKARADQEFADLDRTLASSSSAEDGSGGVSLMDVTLGAGEGGFRFSAQAELGVLAVLSHTLQFGTDGTKLDYVAEGGQDNLFTFARLAAEVGFAERHAVVFLYQPFTLQTSVVTERELKIYDAVFAEGTPLRLRYGFDFVRASYLYDLLEETNHELSVGVSLQLRNAVIDFSGGDGATFISSRNVGPVPILKARWRYTFDNAAFVGAEIDGFYANIPIANGDLESSVQGAVCDASLRAGIPIAGFANSFVNLRYIGGGSEGTEVGGDDVEGDGYADNWLHTLAISLGFELR